MMTKTKTGMSRRKLLKAGVEEIRPFLTGGYGVRLKTGKEFTVTRTYKKNLKALAEFWMGGTSSLSG